ncbi:MAG: hypothetical protein ACXU9J_10810 [Syntrophales bacterium]
MDNHIVDGIVDFRKAGSEMALPFILVRLRLLVVIFDSRQILGFEAYRK